MTAITKAKHLIPAGLIHRAAALALTSVPYITPTKLLNLVRCEAEKLRRIARLRSFPYVAIIDVTNTCNLRCPYCPTGARRDSGRKKGMIEPETIKQLIDGVGKYIISANLFNWGEPLLHPQIAAIVRMLHEARIFTVISTNLNIAGSNLLNRLCGAGLDYLVVSVSGASQEVYQQYHRQGRLDLAIKNTRLIVENRRGKNGRRPVIEWKYLVFRHNLHEVEAARNMAKDIGVDIFRAVRAGGADESEIKDGQASERKLRVRFCHQLWHAIVLNVDAGIAPCCFMFYKKDDFNNFSQDIFAIRNSERGLTARNLFNPSNINSLPPDLQHPCLKCGLVHEQPHLHDYLKSNPNARREHRTGGA
jgi:MoaA/NifB/PqqE/SkfB family radical SAM enzyme